MALCGATRCIGFPARVTKLVSSEPVTSVATSSFMRIRAMWVLTVPRVTIAIKLLVAVLRARLAACAS
jgi:hypothetical protein